MENKKIHYIIIPVLIVLLTIYSYQRMNKEEEIAIESNVEKPNSKDDVEAQIGNCYSYEENGNYYGVIIINYEDNDLFTEGVLYEVGKKELNIKDFEFGNLICAKSELIKGLPVHGLWTGTFLKDDLKVFKEKFKYIGKINLDQSKIKVNGGGSLITLKEVNVKDLHDSELLKGISRYNDPMVKYIEQ